MGFSKKKKISNIYNNIKINKIIWNDNSCFTQGLLYNNGKVFISCGLYGKSVINIFKLTDDNRLILENIIKLPKNIFAEGLSIIGDYIYCLTWKSKKGFIIDKNNNNIVDTFVYPFEGWGLTSVNNILLISNGTNIIYKYCIINRKVLSTIKIISNKILIDKINELEYIDGKIFANMWYSNYIIQINYYTGIVEKIYNLSEISINNISNGVLNGITKFSDNQLLITGKEWNNMYIISI